MGVDKIIKLVGVLVALVAGLIGGFMYSALLIAVLGLAGGWFIEKDDRMRFLVATIALIEVQGFLADVAVGRAERLLDQETPPGYSTTSRPNRRFPTFRI